LKIDLVVALCSDILFTCFHDDVGALGDQITHHTAHQVKRLDRTMIGEKIFHVGTLACGCDQVAIAQYRVN
jgi:hypothetical protein